MRLRTVSRFFKRKSPVLANEWADAMTLDPQDSPFRGLNRQTIHVSRESPKAEQYYPRLARHNCHNNPGVKRTQDRRRVSWRIARKNGRSMLGQISKATKPKMTIPASDTNSAPISREGSIRSRHFAEYAIRTFQRSASLGATPTIGSASGFATGISLPSARLRICEIRIRKTWNGAA